MQQDSIYTKEEINSLIFEKRRSIKDLKEKIAKIRREIN